MLTKIQYNNFETGEFDAEKERTLDETIQLIEAFPWQQQREHYTVGLIGPSITIQRPDNDYLKLAAYYHGKFVLYLFNKSKTLFSKPFDNLADTLPLVQAFFDDTTTFDTTPFKKQTTWFQHPATHFVTCSFIYDLNGAKLLGGSAILFFIFVYVFLALYGVFFGRPSTHPLLFVAIPFLMAFCFFLRLFLNHVNACRGKVLILSKGRPEFAFGPANAPIWMKKADVVELITHGRRGRGGGFGAMTRSR